jgi:hypothetical protein
MPVTIGSGWTVGPGFTVGELPPFGISFVSSAIFSVNSSDGTSSAVTLPAAIQANDIIVVYCTTGNSNSSTPPTQTTPSGYTLIDAVTASSAGAIDAERANLYHKVAVSGDAGATLTITSSTSDYRAICVAVFRTTKGSAPTITNASINSAGGTANLANQTVTAGSGVAPLIVFGAYVNTSTRTFTPTQDGEVVTSNTRVLRYKIYNSAPANTTVGSTIDASTICMQSFYMAAS